VLLPVELSSRGKLCSFGCHEAAARHEQQTAAKRQRSYGEEQ
jgi:hypothetical protein